MKLTPHLSFDGRCREALEFYQRCLGAKIEFMLTYGKAPISERVPAEWREKIIHASFAVGESSVNAADAMPEHYQQPNGFHITIGVQDAGEAERIFGELSEGGTVQMPLQKTFWSVRFGVVIDRFGIPWEVNCQQAPK